MTDIIDAGCDREEKDREIALAHRRAWVDPTPPRGCCYNCEEPIAPGERFCDADCRDDFDKRTRAGAAR